MAIENKSSPGGERNALLRNNSELAVGQESEQQIAERAGDLVIITAQTDLKIRRRLKREELNFIDIFEKDGEQVNDLDSVLERLENFGRIDTAFRVLKSTIHMIHQNKHNIANNKEKIVRKMTEAREALVVKLNSPTI